jgi:pimeloyl-ACP methyl ester carboxylesterase
MFVQEAGPPDGIPVVLIHDTGAWSEIWRETMTALAAAGFHAVALDMPPFGFSQRPSRPSYGDDAQARRILGALDSLGLTSAVLVGHSYGARPTVEAALLAPDRVRALVLVDAALDLHISPVLTYEPSPLFKVLEPPSVRNALVAATLTNPLLTKRLFRLLLATPDAATGDRVRMLQRPFAVAGTTSSFGEWFLPFVTTRERTLCTSPARIHSLTMPSLVLWGGRDGITPLPRGKEIAGLLPGATWRVLPTAGHIPAVEAPGEFNAALLAFLRRATEPQP